MQLGGVARSGRGRAFGAGVQALWCILRPVPHESEASEEIRGPAARLADTVYSQLRAIAQHQMNAERAGHTLTATALVHEAFLRLGPVATDWPGFCHAAAEAMRRILIEHARSRARLKRGGGAAKLPLDAIGDVADLDALTEERSDAVLAFDGAFRRLEEQEPLVAGVVRLRFYAGLGVPETARALSISERTVNNYWAFARAWLARELQDAAGGPGLGG
jgi:RNA polymerase sigma factor (TIGR02999 family)